MNFTHFHQIFLQQGIFHCSRSNRVSMQTLKKQDWTELSLRNNVYNAKLTLKTRLKHGFAIDYTYFQ